jgi:hypothetical protein
MSEAGELADRVLDRLRRIDALRRAEPSAAGGGLLIGELRALVGEAEAWARAEGDARACDAAAELRTRTEGMR